MSARVCLDAIPSADEALHDLGMFAFLPLTSYPHTRDTRQTLRSSSASLRCWRSSTPRYRRLFNPLIYTQHLSKMCCGGGAYNSTGVWLRRYWRPYRSQGPTYPFCLSQSTCSLRGGALRGPDPYMAPVGSSCVTEAA